ncbi:MULTISPECIES: PucR family transcriptional regulator [Enterococcus]|uniref:Purine catabolism regulatory protein n=1 Tax=Candidatus Enterococcus ferrettii TaxID=2815324 RepID=A0ABV0EQF1_9ENTE|nr:PucR family transcriptional regulator [Enterococcus sp. 665A]MBO1341462.1 PucR family transcriptional regulator [Enterococcus sp. 665A]
MKLKELLAQGELKTSKILTKDIGLENDVESAMVLEAMDIENWSKKNQLILTSFYAFNGVPEDDLEEFFSKMQQIGVSGLVVKMDRLIKIIPKWVIELSFKYEIPLIKIAQEVSYEKILLTIYEPLLNYQTHILRTYYEVRQRFTKLERSYPSLEQIMEEFYQIINYPCNLKLIDKQQEIYFGKVPKNDVVLNRESLASGEFTKNDYTLLTLFSQQEGKTRSALEVSLFNPYSSNCLLLVYLDQPEVKETDLMIIENTIDVLQEKFNTEYLLKKERYERLNNLADAILQNTPNNLEELESLLKEADMNQYTFYQAIAFPTKTPEAQLIKDRTLNLLKTLKSKSIFFDHHNYSLILLNFDQEKGIAKTDVKRLLTEILEFHPAMTFVLSSLKRKHELKEILMECLDILNFSEEFYHDDVVELADIGIFRHFIRSEQLEMIDELVPAKLLALSQESYDLFETFYQFLHNNRNYKQTAEAMFLHSKTIRYRLTKIEQFLSIELDDPLQVMNHEIGTYIIKMRRNAIEKNNHPN